MGQRGWGQTGHPRAERRMPMSRSLRGFGIALLVWMYMVSLVILVGAEFNAMLFPRGVLGKPSPVVVETPQPAAK